MDWSGVWRNQYGSVLELTGERDGVVEGWFTSAIDGGIQGIADTFVRVESFGKTVRW